VKKINEIKEVISAVENKKFSEFSKKVKTSLEDKLRNNNKIKDAGDELLKMQKMKDTFAKIQDNNTEVTPEPEE
jgi:c-di-AMP phosphodiesterase-like protein